MGTPLKILRLLTTSSNDSCQSQKVVETVERVDAVFFVGDLVNVPDRASGGLMTSVEVLYFRVFRVVPIMDKTASRLPQVVN